MNRREFLKLAALGGLSSLVLPSSGCGSGQGGDSSSPFFDHPPNILILMTDEQRAFQHWPAGWAEANLPSFNRLRAHGLNFNLAFTNSCQCSPSRSTFLTSTYAPVNGVTITPGTLTTGLPNLASILASAGYNVVYKGKWHLTAAYVSPFAPSTPEDIQNIIENDQGLEASYGFSRWNSPDAGTSASASTIDMQTLGGGKAANDARYVSGFSYGPNAGNVLQFIQQYHSDAPFCLIVSLVNPHDVYVYPSAINISGYDPEQFASLPIELPATWNEDLSTKPSVQAAFKNALNQEWPFSESEPGILYPRFYAYLNKLVDSWIVEILDALDAKRLTERTLIVRVADHGELGLSHGLRQKDYTAYEEMIRVPMVFSNPVLFPVPLETDALASLIDVLPTLLNVVGLKSASGQWNLKGKDLTALFSRPSGSVQDRILFTYDDQLLLDQKAFDFQGPAHIRCIRERDWKYAMYFDPTCQFDPEYEMYDLKNDPLETFNLANGTTPPRYQAERERLAAQLKATMEETGTQPSQCSSSPSRT